MDSNTVKSRMSILLVMLVIAGMPTNLDAQHLLKVSPGSRIRLRIDSSPSWIVGNYQGRRADSLRIALSEESEESLFNLSSITEVEMSKGRFQNIRKSARYGAAIGAGVGAIATIFSTGGDGASDLSPPVLIVGISLCAGAGAVTGILSHAVIGIFRGESWTPVSLNELSASEHTQSFRVGYRFRF